MPEPAPVAVAAPAAGWRVQDLPHTTIGQTAGVEISVSANHHSYVELLAALREVQAGLQAMSGAHRKIAEHIWRAAKARVPSRTGSLKQALFPKWAAEDAWLLFKPGYGSGYKYKGQIRADPGTAFWGHIVEKGHVLPQGGYVPPTFFAAKSASLTQKYWVEEYHKSIKKTIIEAGLSDRYSFIDHPSFGSPGFPNFSPAKVSQLPLVPPSIIGEGGSFARVTHISSGRDSPAELGLVDIDG